jgi:hypothetical protein
MARSKVSMLLGSNGVDTLRTEDGRTSFGNRDISYPLHNLYACRASHREVCGMYGRVWMPCTNQCNDDQRRSATGRSQPFSVSPSLRADNTGYCLNLADFTGMLFTSSCLSPPPTSFLSLTCPVQYSESNKPYVTRYLGHSPVPRVTYPPINHLIRCNCVQSMGRGTRLMRKSRSWQPFY